MAVLSILHFPALYLQTLTFFLQIQMYMKVENLNVHYSKNISLILLKSAHLITNILYKTFTKRKLNAFSVFPKCAGPSVLTNNF